MCPYSQSTQAHSLLSSSKPPRTVSTQIFIAVGHPQHAPPQGKITTATDLLTTTLIERNALHFILAPGVWQKLWLTLPLLSIKDLELATFSPELGLLKMTHSYTN